MSDPEIIEPQKTSVKPANIYHPAPHHWVGLCLVTESNLMHEWGYIAWVIRNRVDSGRFKHSYEQVILQPWQFSAFNKWTTMKDKADPMTVFRLMSRGYYWSERLFHAVDVAREVIHADRDMEAPFSINVCHYWSPVSMRPPGSAPKWKDDAKRLFTPEGVDPNRFVFAEGVR